MTPARQRNAVSEGAALGLLLCGRAELPFDKINVDLAFAGAWRGWTYGDRFPQVNTDLTHGLDAYLALTHAEETRQVWAMFWVNEGNRLVIHTRDPDWSADNPGLEHALSMIDGGVPRDGWVGFAESFLARFDC